MYFRPLSYLTAGAAALALVGGVLLAQEQQQPAQPAPEAQEAQETEATEARKDEGAISIEGKNGVGLRVARHFRTEQITSMDVQNEKGEDLGNIHDLVIDAYHGKVRYAALSFGGFLGLGDDLFAIPWEALEFKYAPDEQHFILHVARETLENAEGFDKNNWPKYGDRQWMQKTDRHFGIDRERRGEEAQRNGQARDEQVARDEQARDRRDDDRGGVFQKKPEGDVLSRTVFRASEITGMDVRNPGGEELGNIHEMVVDLTSGDVNYCVLSFGGFVGLGNKLFAIPHQEMRLMYDHKAEEYFFELDISREQLDQAEGFDRDAWPDTAREGWGRDIDKHYGTDRERAAERQPRRTPVRN